MTYTVVIDSFLILLQTLEILKTQLGMTIVPTLQRGNAAGDAPASRSFRAMNRSRSTPAVRDNSARSNIANARVDLRIHVSPGFDEYIQAFPALQVR